MIPEDQLSYYVNKDLDLNWGWLVEQESGMAMYRGWKIIWERSKEWGQGAFYTAHNGSNEIHGDGIAEILYRIDYGLL